MVLLRDVLMNRLPGLRILFMSGYDDRTQAGIGALCGRFDLITKPFTITDLVAKLDEGASAAARAAPSVTV